MAVEPEAAEQKRRVKPGSDSRLAAACSLVAALIPAAVWLIYFAGPERWWWAGFALYLPQAIWGVPALAALPLALWRARRWAVLPALGLGLTAGPLMGLAIPWRSAAAKPGDQRLRVMTFNIKRARVSTEAVLDSIRREAPDLLMVQELRNDLGPRIHALFPGFHGASDDQFLLISRLPIASFRAETTESNGVILRYGHGILRSRQGDIAVYVVHFFSPRGGLKQVGRRGDKGGGAMEKSARQRLEEGAALARALAQETRPAIVAGDFNAPLASLACRPIMERGYTDAFAAAGLGYGYTYGHHLPLRLSFMRIDHIFTSPQWAPAACHAGDPGGSDHRPVIADLLLRASR